MEKTLEEYQSISEYLAYHHYKPKEDGSGFVRGNKFIPADKIGMHSVRSFHRLAVAEKWIESEKSEDNNDEFKDDIARIYGYATDFYNMVV